jgi:predicted outer membrane protein
MKSLMIGLAIALAASSASALADTQSDAAFVQKAQSDLLGQYALAVLARSHGASPAVQSLANQIATNATAGNTFLSNYAKAHGITLSGKPTFRADSQYGEMSGSKGSDFDSRFAQDIYADAQLQQGDFQTSVSDPNLQRFADRENQEMTQIGNQAEKLGG